MTWKEWTTTEMHHDRESHSLVDCQPIPGTDAGSAYLLHGPLTGDFYLSTDSELQLAGASVLDYAGYAISGGGDFNGDGNIDVVVGAYNADSNGSGAGAAYIVTGPLDSMKDIAC